MLEDLAVAVGSWRYDLAGEDVGVDDGEGVGWGGEEARDGGFSGREGAR